MNEILNNGASRIRNSKYVLATQPQIMVRITPPKTATPKPLL